MTTLTAAKRKKIPTSKFALEGERKYPLDTRARAINAKARAAQQVKKGNLSESSKKKIDSKANKVIGHRTLSGVRK